MIQGADLIRMQQREGISITNEWLDGILSLLLATGTTKGLPSNRIISGEEITALIDCASQVIMSEGALVEVNAPIKVIGDIHGQFQDMQKLFDIIGRVPKIKMLFLGDYVDRGTHSIETIVYLLALKIRYPSQIYLLRGNHETPTVNRIYGFYNECVAKYSSGLWWDFQSIFNRLPLAGLISKRILCMHGGLSPFLTNLDQIRQIPLPCEPADKGMLIDLLWADPTNKGDGWFHSPRGISYAFGRGVVGVACKMLGVDLIIRAHQVVQDGYELMIGRMLITIFSAPNYAGQFNNAGAVVCIDEELKVSFQQMRSDVPLLKCRPCPSVACAPGEALLIPSRFNALLSPETLPASVTASKVQDTKDLAVKEQGIVERKDVKVDNKEIGKAQATAENKDLKDTANKTSQLKKLAVKSEEKTTLSDKGGLVMKETKKLVDDYKKKNEAEG